MSASLSVANVGVPILFFALPVALYLLTPVIVLETWVAQQKVAELAPSRRLAGVVLANVVSTLGGWPLMWFFFAVLQGAITPGGGEAHGLIASLAAMASNALQTARLILQDDQLYWMVPRAAMILMIPALVLAILIEGSVLKFCWRDVPSKKRIHFVVVANVFSCGLALGLIWLLYSTASIALSITLVVAAFCIAWTGGHRPRRNDLGHTPEQNTKMREFMVQDIRANSQYCSWYITLIAGIATLVAANRQSFRMILSQEYLWPFGLSFLAASMATIFLPAGYGDKRFKALRVVWFRSVLCEQMVIIFSCYGVCNAFIALTHGKGLSDKAPYLQLF